MFKKIPKKTKEDPRHDEVVSDNLTEDDIMADGENRQTDQEKENVQTDNSKFKKVEKIKESIVSEVERRLLM